jgi:hypothetical protein
VVLAFDGSFNGDTTVLTVATVDQRPHVDLVELWEAAGRQVPIVDVEQAIRQACRRWRVLEIAAAVASVMAHDRAAALADVTRDSIYL